MGNVLSKGSLFPEQLVSEMINLVRGKSSLARLSQARPVPFNGEKVFTFNFDSEIDVVAENGAKSNGGATIGTVSMAPIKVEYGMRVSDEFRFASDEVQLEYLQAFAEGFASKVARGIDIMAFHGLNPRTRQAASGTIGNNHFDSKVSQTVAFNASTPSANVQAAIEMIEAAEHEATGMAMAPTMKNALAALTKGSSSYEPMFPELAWGANPGTLNGLPVDTNGTVNFDGNTDKAIVGNFRDFFRWGYSRQMPIEIIEYGNPDNSDAGDLKGHNQIYLRGEAYIAWAILVPAAFVRIVGPAVSLSDTKVTITTTTGTTITATTVPSGQSVTWASADTSVVTVADGALTGVAAGKANVTATYSNATATCEVTVTSE